MIDCGKYFFSPVLIVVAPSEEVAGNKYSRHNVTDGGTTQCSVRPYGLGSYLDF